jgi:Flp pilus assembly protein TadB
MAQKRRRKHRGTQAGTVEARGRTSRPTTSSQKPAAKTSRQRREERLSRPPTWRGSVNRALLAAVAFGAFIAITAKKNKVVEGVVFAAIVFLFYLPMTYYLDRFMYRRRQRRQAGR